MLLGRGEERSGGRQKSVLLANALEALIAALYLDGGLKATTRFVNQWIVNPYLDELHAELTAGQAMGDHKSALQEWLQAHKAGHPHYTVKAESGPDHRKRFLVELQILNDGGKANGFVIAEGMGSTKKKAEQEAARLAYAALVKDSDRSFQSPAAKVS
jgi:ribonuclease-3